MSDTAVARTEYCEECGTETLQWRTDDSFVCESCGEIGGWSGPETASFDHHPIGLLNEFPLPTDEADVAGLWRSNDQLQHEYDDPPHPTELHEQSILPIHEHGPWRVFRIGIYGFDGRLYFWNSFGGHGFYVTNIEGETDALRQFFENWAREEDRNIDATEGGEQT